ncbi:MAG: hypothetical protein QOJ42_8209 [Acidobacteriaceae bacterium]|jgi:hypothetical protein|nr:hypothetical protein [Acidobacteriaceae bacterium]
MSFEKLYELLILSTDGCDRLEHLLHPFYRKNLSEDQLFTILRDEWVWFHNISDNLEELGEVFPLYGPVRTMMTPEENAAYDALPDILTAHRGCDAGWLDGLSWSLNKKVANWFAFYPLTQAEEPTLVTARVEKKFVMAIKLGRGEEEIITFGADVQRVEPADPGLYKDYCEERAAKRIAR